MSDPVTRPAGTPPLSPPGRPPGRRGRGSGMPSWGIIAAFILLLGLAAVVILVLPGLNHEPGISVKQRRATTPTDATITAVSPAAANETGTPGPVKAVSGRDLPGTAVPEVVPIREKAVMAQRKWFQQQARAEAENMGKWGDRQYREALALAEKGSHQIQKYEFAPAIISFASAEQKITGLDGIREEVLEKALEKGGAALDKGDADMAKRQFNLALAIDPGNQGARSGLKRASTLSSVFEMTQEAGKHLEAGSLEEAQRLLSRAVKFDPHFTAASDLLRETRKRIRRQNFEKGMGTALSALAANNLGRSQRALERAAGIYPEDPAVTELSSRLIQAEKAQSLRLHLDKARDYSEKEMWADAASWYKKTLSIAPQSLSALEGMANARRLLAIQAALEKIILHPKRLKEAGPLKDARQTIQVARAVKDKGPVLTRKIEQADAVVRLAVRPVPVTFVSDGETKIVIFHLGGLGRFHRRTISLKPGNYTVTGSRPGYRDLRKEVLVKGTAPEMRVSIACDEKL